MTTFDEINKEARSWLDVRFKKGGRDRYGVDCIGLLVNVGRNCGIEIEDTIQYSFDPEPQKFIDLVYGQTYHHPHRGIKPGVLVLLRQSVFAMHTGIVSKDNYGRLTIINANLRSRKVVEQQFNEWDDLIIAFRTYKGM